MSSPTSKLHSFSRMAAALMLLGISLVACSSAPSKASSPENGDSWSNSTTRAPWAISRDRNTYRFEVRQADRSDWDSKHNHISNRAEISSNYRIPVGVKFEFGFSMQVASSGPITSRWMTLGQLRPPADANEKLLSIWGQNLFAPGNNFSIFVRATNKHGRPAKKRIVLYQDENFDTSKVHKFRYEMMVPQRGDGMLKAWIDEVQVVDYTGKIGYQSKTGGYLKLGIYRAPAPETVSATYRDVFLRFASCASPSKCRPAELRPHVSGTDQYFSLGTRR